MKMRIGQTENWRDGVLERRTNPLHTAPPLHYSITPSLRPASSLITRRFPGGQHLLRRDIVGDELAVKFGEGSGREVCPGVGHDFDEDVRVMDADHAQAEDFVHVQQMPKVRPREMFAG